MNGMFWVYVAYSLGLGLMLGYAAYIFLSIRHARGRKGGAAAGDSAVSDSDYRRFAHDGDIEVKG